MNKLQKRLVSESHLNNSEWPEAIPEHMVCKTEQDLHTRALIISEWVGNKGPVLDFGCQDEKLSDILNSQSIPTTPYKLESDWSKIKNQTFMTVVLHDVIDHILEDRVKVLKKIKTILEPEGTIKVRCHPWCSRHGGHQFSTNNKAFAHLVYPEKWPTEKIIDPIKNYENIFKFSGLKIVEKICYRFPIEDWILRNFGRSLLRYWPENMWKNQDCPAVLPYLELEYIDYDLVKQENK